jgi:MYXO-CTERM domain-containing protein
MMRKNLLFVLIASCMFSGLANASIVVSLDGSPEFNGTDYTWTYTADLGPDEGIGFSTPSYFTIYDLAGLNGVISLPSGWTYTEQLTGVTPSTVTVPDNPDIENVTFDYTGSSLAGPQSLGDFVITSVDGAQTDGVFSYQTGISPIGGPINPQDDIVDQGSGSVAVPTAASPEPKLGLLMVLAVGLLGLRARRRRTAI